VARDRQRAKQRRNKPGAGGPAAGSARAKRRRDAGLEPTDTDLSGATPAPEPTKHAFPNVEEAQMAEAGAITPDEQGEAGDEAGELPDFERAPDTLERDLAPASAQHREATRERRPQRGRVITFLGHVIDELRRVQWPDRRQVGQGTLVTLVFVLIAGGYLGLLDAIWRPVIEAIL
jgi:preprotein translocase SecE subunit